MSTFFELLLLDDTIHELIPEKGVVLFELRDLVLQLGDGAFVELLFLHYLRQMDRYCVLDLVLGLCQIGCVFFELYV